MYIIGTDYDVFRAEGFPNRQRFSSYLYSCVGDEATLNSCHRSNYDGICFLYAINCSGKY